MIQGQRLRHLREAKQISRKQLAALIDIHESQLYKYEVGKTDTTTFTLVKLADHFQVSTDYLLGRTDEH